MYTKQVEHKVRNLTLEYDSTTHWPVDFSPLYKAASRSGSQEFSPSLWGPPVQTLYPLFFLEHQF